MRFRRTCSRKRRRPTRHRRWCGANSRGPRAACARCSRRTTSGASTRRPRTRASSMREAEGAAMAKDLHQTHAFTVMKALMLARSGDAFHASVAQVDEKDLPEGDVTLRIDYSTLNYKDGLAIANAS